MLKKMTDSANTEGQPPEKLKSDPGEPKDETSTMKNETADKKGEFSKENSIPQDKKTPSLEEKPSKSESKKDRKPKSEVEKLKDEITELKKKLTAKDQEIENQKSKYRYLQAEMENTRKHYLKQQDTMTLKTKVNTITRFTPLIDAFENAFETAKKQKKNDTISPECQIDNFMAGFEKLHDMLKDIFKSFNVVAIDKTGIAFNYNFHEVMMKVINDDIPEDTVVQIIQKGYKIKDQVIQPAKVIVSKHTPPPVVEKKAETVNKDNDQSTPEKENPSNSTEQKSDPSESVEKSEK